VRLVSSYPAVDGVDTALEVTREWLERHSGWAPPDHVTLAEWLADGPCRCPDDCLAEADGWCEHGLASWWLILTEPRRHGTPEHWDPGLLLPHPLRLDLRRPAATVAVAAHEAAVAAGEPTYPDPRTGLTVMTAKTLWDRGWCCSTGCRHCPYLPITG